MSEVKELLLWVGGVLVFVGSRGGIERHRQQAAARGKSDLPTWQPDGNKPDAPQSAPTRDAALVRQADGRFDSEIISSVSDDWERSVGASQTRGSSLLSRRAAQAMALILSTMRHLHGAPGD